MPTTNTDDTLLKIDDIPTLKLINSIAANGVDGWQKLKSQLEAIPGAVLILKIDGIPYTTEELDQLRDGLGAEKFIEVMTSGLPNEVMDSLEGWLRSGYRAMQGTQTDG